MSDLDLTQVDFEQVQRRLTLHAVRLFLAFAGLTRDSVASGIGFGADDLAMQTILKFIDPMDETVTWQMRRGQPTTDGVLRFLRTVLRNDLIDLLRQRAHTTTVIVDSVGHGTEDDPGKTMSLDEFESTFEAHEMRAIRENQQSWLLKQFDDDPALRDVLSVQLDPDGYQAFTNQEMAELLDVTVSEIENRKKRLRRRLLRIARKVSGLYERNPI